MYSVIRFIFIVHCDSVNVARAGQLYGFSIVDHRHAIKENHLLTCCVTKYNTDKH